MLITRRCLQMRTFNFRTDNFALTNTHSHRINIFSLLTLGEKVMSLGSCIRYGTEENRINNIYYYEIHMQHISNTFIHIMPKSWCKTRLWMRRTSMVCLHTVLLTNILLTGWLSVTLHLCFSQLLTSAVSVLYCLSYYFTWRYQVSSLFWPSIRNFQIYLYLFYIIIFSVHHLILLSRFDNLFWLLVLQQRLSKTFSRKT